MKLNVEICGLHIGSEDFVYPNFTKINPEGRHSRFRTGD